MKAKNTIIIAGLSGLIATGLAAIGSHVIHFNEGDVSLFEKAVNFQYWHTLALLGCVFLANHGLEKFSKKATMAFTLGIIFFSGSLYWRAIMGAGSLGSFHWITPIGGLFFMAGWVAIALAGFSKLKK